MVSPNGDEHPPPNKRTRVSPIGDEQPPPSKRTKVEPLTEDMQTYASYLKSVYTKPGTINYDKWPHVTSEKYTNLALIGKRGRSKEESEQFTKATIRGNIDDIVTSKAPMSMDEVACNLKDGSLPKCILVEGAPGVGKSTFAWELCGKWGKGEMLQQYKLVVLLRLREKKVRKAKTVEDLFRYHNKRVRQAVVEEIEQTGGKGVLLLLEGYDELPVKERSEDSFFMSVINGDELPEATILVTSRHSGSDTLHRCNECRRQISQHVEIIGFTKSNINAYLESSSNGDSHFLSGIHKYLECYPHIHSMMYVPLNSAIVVEVYRNSKKERTLVPKTMTELYFSLIRSLLLRYIYKHPEHSKKQWNIRSFSDLPQEMFDRFCQVARIAHEGFFNDQQVVFSDLPDEFDSLGLMQCVPELYVDQGTVLSYNFLHMTIQEFLTAFHMSQLPVAEQAKAFSELMEQEAFNVVLRFLAGLTKFADVPSESLRLIFGFKALNTFHWIFETQNDISRLLNVVAQDGCCEVIGRTNDSFARLRPFDAYVLGYCTAHSNCTWKYVVGFTDQDAVDMLAHGASQAGSNCNGKILVLNLNFQHGLKNEVAQLPVFPQPLINSLTSIFLICFKIDNFFTTLSNSASLTKVALKQCDVSAADCKALYTIPALEELHLQELYDSEIFGTEHLLINSSLKVLKIIYCTMSDAEADCLVTALQDNTTLEKLVICSDIGSVMGGDKCIALSKTLSQNNSLKSLKLRGCGIGPVGASCLTAALCDNHTLEELNLSYNTIMVDKSSNSDNKFSDGSLESHTQEQSRCVSNGVSGLAEMLTLNTTLRILHLGACSISSYEVDHLSHALCSSKTLEELDLSFNAIGDEETAALAAMLLVNKSLKSLDLSFNTISDKGTAALADTLTVNESLKQLDLSYNAIGNEGATALARMLSSNKTLQLLDLSDNAFGNAGTTALARMLTVNKTLEEMNFSRNRFGGKSVTALIKMLEENKTLKQLKLIQTVSEEGALKLMESLAHNATLETLWLDHELIMLPEKLSANRYTYERYEHRIRLLQAWQ